MSKQKAENQAAPEARGLKLTAVLPLLLFVVIIGAGGFLALRQQEQVKVGVKLRQETNEKLGLPLDYPLELFPLYDGMQILETERGSAEATDGGKLNKWLVKGETTDSKDELFEFYNTLLLERGMRQTMYISIPSGMAVHYGDEKNIAEFEIERQEDKSITQLKMTVYTPAR